MASSMRLLRQSNFCLQCYQTLFVKNLSTSLGMYAVKAGALTKKGKKGAAVVTEREYLQVETDVGKLTKYCCGLDIRKDGQDPELKPDSEYPDWLWTLRTERGSQNLSELTENDHAYWRILRKAYMKKKNLIRKQRFK